MRSFKVTEEAIGIIDAAPSQGPLRIAEYAKALPPRAAALKRVLLERGIGKAVERYREADFAALDAQARFRRLGWTAAYAGFLAAVLGGVLLYLASDASTASIRSNLGLVQSALLSVSLFCSAFLFVLKPFREWGLRRGDAEAMRLQIFGLVMWSDESGDNELSGQTAPGEVPLPLLPLQLECFRRHLLDDTTDLLRSAAPAASTDRADMGRSGSHCIPARPGIDLRAGCQAGGARVRVDALRRFMASLALDQRGLCVGRADRRLAARVAGGADGHVACRAQCQQVQGNALAARQDTAEGLKSSCGARRPATSAL